MSNDGLRAAIEQGLTRDDGRPRIDPIDAIERAVREWLLNLPPSPAPSEPSAAEIEAAASVIWAASPKGYRLRWDQAEHSQQNDCREVARAALVAARKAQK